MIEIKRCPLCGAPPTTHIKSTDTYHVELMIICFKCSLEMHHQFNGNPNTFDAMERAMENIITQWNTRVNFGGITRVKEGE